MIGHIFYFIGIFVMILSIYNIINYFKYARIKKWANTFKKVTGKTPNIPQYPSKEDHDTFISYPIISYIQTIWFLLGLVSNSWYLFLTLILTNVLFSFLLRKINIHFIENFVSYIFNIIKFFLILATIINHFHIHYDWLILFR